VKLACVIHRFGADIAGGSEGHCRAIAQHLASTHDVTIVTTCAKDHVSWANHYPEGESRDGALTVVRVPVARQRDLYRFRDISDRLFSEKATAEEQEQWFRENGPDAPELLAYLRRTAPSFDLILFWSYRYYQSYFGVPIAGDRAVLVPTAEADPLMQVPSLRGWFAQPSGYIFLTPEEVDLLGDRVPPLTPRTTIGLGIDPPSQVPGRAVLAPLNLPDPYILYLGRVDPNKGCDTLLKFFEKYVDAGRTTPLVMAGPVNMPVPEHPLIRRLGYVDSATRDALLAHARVLMMPSPFESLSVVLLEAWNYGVPALVNARCAVLKGQVLRADGGLHYRNAGEFAACLDYLMDRPENARMLGAQGRAYVDREYRWPTVMGKLEQLLNEVHRQEQI
jgi:glycosyltransferase involved in cell wall biosynthesis